MQRNVADEFSFRVGWGQGGRQLSQAVRGKFYREGAKLIGPVHVATDVVERLSEVAAEKGMSASDLANEILRRAIAEMDVARKAR